MSTAYPLRPFLPADTMALRELYAQSIEYTLGAMFSYLETFDPPHLVLVVVGDHQPARIVSGPDAGPDVPITIITKDSDAMARTDPWGWDAGLIPTDEAPEWSMDDFRDRFLEAFSE